VEFPVLEDGFERVGQAAEFAFAPDHARLDALDAARADAEGARLGAEHAVDLHGLGPPLNL
jgi:hypothetical protein